MTDLVAAQLAGMGLCTPQCLVSVGTEAERCGCACRGRWHGALASTVVPGSGEYRPAPPEPGEGQEDVLVHLAALTSPVTTAQIAAAGLDPAGYADAGLAEEVA